MNAPALPAISTNTEPRQNTSSGLEATGKELVLWAVLAAASLQAAYLWPQTSWLIVVYLFALLQLARANSWRKAFYSGLLVGLLTAAGQLGFFWNIFGPGAVALWLVYAFWLGLFTALARLCLRRSSPETSSQSSVSQDPGPINSPTRLSSAMSFGRAALGWLLIPFIWCGLEYFRSELYYLRFSWLSPGFAFGEAPYWVPLHALGTYGLGFILMGLACGAAIVWRRSKLCALGVLVGGIGALRLWAALPSAQASSPTHGHSLRIAGVQMEFPTENEVLVRLNGLLRRYPEADLFVLSEYTFTEPVPDRVTNWCREHRRYLVVGGKDPLTGGNFYNTAFVISPSGETIFRQVKAVPIQFFKDGLPAPNQAVWNSPWGKIGICICYDLSYRQVTDRLIQLGAEGLIVPTMDVADWGKRQHELHSRVAPLRAAEYGVPIFRLASSGISQGVDRTGRVLATAPCPGDGAVLFCTLDLNGPGRLPVDRWLAPLATGITVLLVICFALEVTRGKIKSVGQVRTVRFSSL